MANRYPILLHRSAEERRNHTPLPKSVPTSLVEGHEAQAEFNHGQTLEGLAGRGGLSPVELWCVVNDKKWQQRGAMTDAKAIEWLRDVDDVEWVS